MIKDRINDEYFEWLFHFVCDERYAKQISYRKLLEYLHHTEFTYILRMDKNRAHDGIDLRYRYSLAQGYEEDYFAEYLDGPCSVLEMLIALSIRCEENIMDDPRYGDRTGQWFWGMINTLGLGAMIDSRFDEEYVIETVERFLNREYEPDGSGGLFRIKDCDADLRDVEIWYQLNWYLDSLIG